MIWHQPGDKPLSDPMMGFCTKIFIQENEFESVLYKMLAILSQPQCVNKGLVCIVALTCEFEDFM